MTQSFLQSVWLIPVYSMLGAITALLWSPAIIRRTGPRPAGYVNILMTVIAFIHCWLALIACQDTQYLELPWLKAAGLNLNLSIEISQVTIGAAMLICGLNLLAQIFAVGYMEMDWGWARFFSFLAIFEAGMTALVFCNSLFFAYIILEILTLATYLLIGLWFSQPLVITGARDAFLTKRVGDLVLLIGVVALLPAAHTWNFNELTVWAKTADLDPTIATCLGLALLAGPMGKAAQFPLHLWLDEAMEGPIPSTILRNSVVVSVGIWVLVKLQPLFALSPTTLATMEWVGGITAVCSTLIAIAQIDIKRILSYSVSAYMGLAFMAVANGQTVDTLAFIFNYAIAMALLVMGVGGVIWNGISQDVRQYGGLWSRRPVTGGAVIIGALGLLAVPPFGGFWAVLDIVTDLLANKPVSAAVFIVVNGLTAFSLTRLFGLIWGGKTQEMTERSPEIHWPMALPIIITMGLVLHTPLILLNWGLLPTRFTLGTVLVVTASSFLGIAAGALVFLNNNVPKPIKLPIPAVQDFFAYDFYTQKLYKVTIIFMVGTISNITDFLDKYFVDSLVNFIGSVSIFGGESLKYSTSGQSQFYLLTILAGIALIGVILSWSALSQLSLVSG